MVIQETNSDLLLDEKTCLHGTHLSLCISFTTLSDYSPSSMKLYIHNGIENHFDLEGRSTDNIIYKHLYKIKNLKQKLQKH